MAQQIILPPASYERVFATAMDELPGGRNPDVKRLREQGFTRFRALGFPGPKAEAWKYTSVAPLAKREFALAPRRSVRRADIDPYLIGDAKASHLVFVNGYFAPDLSDIVSANGGAAVASLGAALDNGFDRFTAFLPERDAERGFSALNAAFATDGGAIHIPDGSTLDGPVQLLFVHAGGDHADIMSHPRNVVVLGDGARLDLVESHVVLGGFAGLANVVNRMVVGRGAALRHDRLQIGEVSGHLIGKTEYEISADARVTQTLATLGGGTVRNEIQAFLGGPGIEARLNGLFLTRDRQHVDNAIRVEHLAPDCFSDQFYKGVLDGKGRAAFAGSIAVAREAQKTNAYQANNNLLLSPDAEINTKPELVIFADDVRCSHGATAGELDERELFYLRSRGLDPETAQSLLTYAFADEVVERFVHTEITRQARQEVLKWLPGGPALGELL